MTPCPRPDPRRAGCALALAILLAGPARADEPAGTAPAAAPLAAVPVEVAPPQGVSADTARAFADHLLAADDPYNALTWYRMALFLEPDRPDAEAIRFRMAVAYERGERWAAAEVAYGLVGGDLADRAAYRVGVVNLQAGRHAAAEQAFEALPMYYPGSPWVERARFAGGVAWLDARELDQAARRFQALSEVAEPWGPRAVALSVEAAAPLPRRSPALAAGLSTVLPGAGQVYSGHLGDGVMALIANGVLATWTYSLVRQGVEQDRAWEVGLGSVLGGMAALTWSSNVYGAWRSARRFNDLQRRDRADELLRQAWDPVLELDAAHLVLP